MSDMSVTAANRAAAEQIVMGYGMTRGIVFVNAKEKSRTRELADQISEVHFDKTGSRPEIIISMDDRDEASRLAARKFGTSRKSGFVITAKVLAVAEGSGFYRCPPLPQNKRSRTTTVSEDDVWIHLDSKACLKRLQKLGLANFGKRRMKFTAAQHDARAYALLTWASRNKKPDVLDPLYAMFFQYMNRNNPLYRPGFERKLRKTSGWQFTIRA